MLLPTDVIYLIAGHSRPATQAVLSRCCREFHSICNPVLYRQNVLRHGSSCVFRIIANCSDTGTALAALRNACDAGADLGQYRRVKVRDISAQFDVQYISCPLRTDTLVDVAPLHLAAAQGLEDLAVFLIEHGAAIDGPAQCSPWTPCFMAVYFDSLSTAEILLALGAQPRSDKLGFSLLHLAAATGSHGMTSLLLNSGLFAVDEEDVEGNSALVYALASSRLPYGTQLAGANRYTSGVWGSALLSVGNTRDYRRCIMLASISPTVRQRQETVALLLVAGADANKHIPLTPGWSAPLLFKLCWTNNLWGARFLLERGLFRARHGLGQACARRLRQEGSSPQVMELLDEFGLAG